MTGRPASSAACRTISSGGAPATDSSVNVSCTRSDRRSSSSCASMIMACTVSVMATNGTSRRNAISGTPCRSAAVTSASGSRS